MASTPAFDFLQDIVKDIPGTIVTLQSLGTDLVELMIPIDIEPDKPRRTRKPRGEGKQSRGNAKNTESGGTDGGDEEDDDDEDDEGDEGDGEP